VDEGFDMSDLSGLGRRRSRRHEVPDPATDGALD